MSSPYFVAIWWNSIHLIRLHCINIDLLHLQVVGCLLVYQNLPKGYWSTMEPPLKQVAMHFETIT